MNNKITSFFKNFSYTLFSNLLSLLISTVVILVVPKLIGIKEYGYWQLYLFYVSYVGFFHLGWNDGIYLRYGGLEYKKLDKKMFFSQFYMQLFLQIVIAISINSFVYFHHIEQEKVFILQMIGICLILTNSQNMLSYILQATNRIKEYAQITIINRSVYFIILVLFFLFGIRNFKYMIWADLLGRLVALLLAGYYCRDIIFNKINTLKFDLKEMFTNINVGIKLMFSNIASMLVIGIVRFGIETNWSIETFGKVSLTLSISNMMMIFINALGIIIYPILRRTNKNKYHDIYLTMRDFLMVATLGLLVGYYPLKVILSSWLPEYSDALTYMAIVFPMFIYEGKMSLLANTYLKTLRKEKNMLFINLITVFLSLIFTIISIMIIDNLNLTILSIVILLALRSIISELYISKLLNINIKRDIILELLLTIIFIISGWYVNSGLTIVIYGFSYLMYLIIKRKDNINSYQTLKVFSRT